MYFYILRILAKDENAFVIFNNIPTIWRAEIRTPAQRPFILRFKLYHLQKNSQIGGVDNPNS